MPKHVIVIAEPTEELMGDSLIPQQMIEDMHAISSVPKDAISRLVDALKCEVGIPTNQRLNHFVGEFIPDRSQADAVRRALVNLKQSRVEPFVRDLDEWRKANARNEKALPEGILTSTRENLLQLVQDYPVLERYRKSRRLRALTGNHVEEIDILCDIRPVFDENRSAVEGMIPLTTLKLVYEGQDEERHVVELLLSAEKLDELRAKTEKAKIKLETLREAASKWLPNAWVEELMSQDEE